MLGKDRNCLKGWAGKLVDYDLPTWGYQGIAFIPPPTDFQVLSGLAVTRSL
jgi:hypothetical protein